jgi:hypothetical protein
LAREKIRPGKAFNKGNTVLLHLKRYNMIKPLRKRHFQIWRLWALLLPLGIIAATVAPEPMPKDAFAPPQNGKTAPVLIAEKKVGANQLQLRGNVPGKATQLLWVNREPLKVASATLYLIKAGATTIEGATYIGRIETLGNYVFDLPTQAVYHFLLFDFIHQQVIEDITITPTPNANPQTPNPLP